MQRVAIANTLNAVNKKLLSEDHKTKKDLNADQEGVAVETDKFLKQFKANATLFEPIYIS